MANYQPFLISQFKTGLFNYLQPWIGPVEAFEPLSNAFVYRGVVNKRNGIYPIGECIDLTGIVIDTGDGGEIYSGTLLAIPVRPGTFIVTAGAQTLSDNGDGTLGGAGAGTINYSTGAWTANFTTAVAIATPITADYCVQNGHIAYQDYLDSGDGATQIYSGTLNVDPILGGSLSIFDSVETFTDNGDGTLTGDMGGTGTINYTTGAWSVDFNANVAAGDNIYAIYNPNTIIGERPIMGLKQWINDTTGQTTLIALDTRRASRYDANNDVFVPLVNVSQVVFTGDAAAAPATVNTNWAAVAPYAQVFAPFSVTLSDGTTTVVDDGAGNFNVAGNFAAGNMINYATGVVTLSFVAPPAAGVNITLTAVLAGDYFNGTPSNFFNATNWLDNLYLTNNVDPITVYNGTTLSRPPFSITLANKRAYINNIQTCIDVDVYKNRFLVQRPNLINTTPTGVQSQSIRYSAIQNATNLVADVPGNGGELSAPTGDILQTSEFLRDQLIVFFSNSTWSFRFTGSSFDPFRFDKLNVTKSTNAPYASIPYDERVTSMGAQGLIACDGVNVQRYDVSIIDQFLDIKQARFQQCFGQRFDNLNQSWMLYPTQSAPANSFGDILSNAALIYNYSENSWATYDIRLSCLGLFHATRDATWADFAIGGIYGPLSWDESDFPWNAYLLQDQSPTLLGGGQEGIVYILNNGNLDNYQPITSTFTSTQWNPFGQQGQKVQFGYIDFYYKKDEGCELELTFYVNNSNNPAAIRTLTCDGPSTDPKAMKRIYINAMGEFLQMNINSSSLHPFQIYGMVLWCRPAGRWTP